MGGNVCIITCNVIYNTKCAKIQETRKSRREIYINVSTMEVEKRSIAYTQN
jgi:hypothetical protein